MLLSFKKLRQLLSGRRSLLLCHLVVNRGGIRLVSRSTKTDCQSSRHFSMFSTDINPEWQLVRGSFAIVSIPSGRPVVLKYVISSIPRVYSLIMTPSLSEHRFCRLLAAHPLPSLEPESAALESRGVGRCCTFRIKFNS